MRNIDLQVRRGEFLSIVGRFGSGKSSLLQAVLGEMPNGGGSKVRLNGRVAYASQKPWIVSDTVRNNILFGHAFDAKRYAEALHFACLSSDL